MKTITVEQAKNEEIDWINSQYKTINFVASKYFNEWIVIAKVDGERAGLGRLVTIDKNNIELGGIYVFPSFRGLGVAYKIVDTLCTKGKDFESVIWCLPFENLMPFYRQFGFNYPINQKIPAKITQKLNWCNTESNYTKKVVLLCK